MVDREEAKLAPTELFSNNASLLEHQTMTSNGPQKVTHARTQSELPANFKLVSQNFITSTKKRPNSKDDSALSEKEFDHSEDASSEANNNQLLKSLTSENSNLKSKMNAVSAKQNSNLSFMDKIGTQAPANDNKLEMRMGFPDLPKPHRKTQEVRPTGHEIGKPSLFVRDPHLVPISSETDILRNQNIIPTHLGCFNILPKNNKDDAKLRQLVGSAEKDRLFSPNRKQKEQEKEFKVDALCFQNRLQKRNWENCMKKDSLKEIEIAEDEKLKLSNSFGNEKNRRKNEEEAFILPVKISKKKFATVRDIAELNPEIFEKTRIHIWQKNELIETPQQFEIINLDKKRKLKILDKKFAHLDSIRRFEFIETGNNGLQIVTFSEDSLIKSWKVDLGMSTELLFQTQKQVPKFPNSEYNLDQMELSDQETQKNRESVNFQNSPLKFSPAQFKSGSFAYLNVAPKPAHVKLKIDKVIRVHTSPIFSSCASTSTQGLRRVFSGDCKGNVNCFSMINESLVKTKTFKTGSEPVWSLAFMEPDILLTSSPNKLKLFSLKTSSEKQEDFLYTNYQMFFGQIKAINANSFIVNTYSSATLKNEFLLFDVFKQKEIAKISSNRMFSNAFAFCPQKDLLLSANEDKTVSIYDIREKCQTNHFYAHSDSVLGVDICLEKNLFVTAGADSSVRLWDLRSLRIYDEIRVHRKKYDDSIFDVKFDPAARMIASSGADGALKIFHF